MRASLLALLVLFVAVVAGVAVDAAYIRYYYGSGDCSSSDSRGYQVVFFNCFDYNSTYNLTTESAELGACSGSGRFEYKAYSKSSCGGTYRNFFLNFGENDCHALSTVNGKTGSMKVVCDDDTTTTPSPTASSVSFSTTACAAVTCLLFIISILTF